MSYRTASGQRVTLGRALGSGGEGEIFEVTSPPGLAFKKYLEWKNGREQVQEAGIE